MSQVTTQLGLAHAILVAADEVFAAKPESKAPEAPEAPEAPVADEQYED